MIASLRRRCALPMAWLLAALLLAPGIAAAQAVRDAAPLQFQDAAEERRFHALVAELRCVMCQNQSLADSNAQIAHDLRREVFDLMRSGRSDDEIRSFLVERYGEFVLYRPRFSGHTALLWLAPGLLLLAGGVVVVRIVRARGKRPLTAEEEMPSRAVDDHRPIETLTVERDDDSLGINPLPQTGEHRRLFGVVAGQQQLDGQATFDRSQQADEE
jgi:cytochrome c-type biogenesis protein CcmH